MENAVIEKGTLTDTEYENCRFVNLDLGGADLSGKVFMECRFEGCNLSNAKLHKTAFREVTFSACKMVGLHFEDCLPFFTPPEFLNCQLNLSTFVQCKLPGMKMTNCILEEADLSMADLSGADLSGSDLFKAVFDHTDLRKADLRTSIRYSIDPTANKLKNARFSLGGTPGLLAYFGIIID